MERKNTKIIVACFLLIAITCFGIFAAKSAKSADSKEYENKKIIKKSTEETTTSTVENTTTENTTAKTEPSIDNNDTSSEAWSITIYNKAAEEKNISFSKRFPNDVENILKMIMSDTNLVYTSEDYKDYYQNLSMASENDSLKIWQHIQKNVNGLKDMKLKSILDIYNDSENITYLGNNFWTYANNVDTTVKVYSTEKMEYPSFPYIALTAKLCLPTALADSNTRGDNINDMYSSFTDDDLYKAFDSTEIEFDKISTVESVKQVQNMPDNLTEVLCVFKNPDSYIKLYTSRSSNSGVYGYTYDKNEYNHETGFSNEENCYEYLRVGNDAYYRDNHADMYFKASKFKGKMVKDGESFRDFFIKNYMFSYSFNASVENTPYTIQVYNNGNSYITLVSNPNAKDKLKAWVSDDNGVIVVSDIFMSSDKNSDNVFAAISQSHSYAKEHIGSKKD